MLMSLLLSRWVRYQGHTSRNWYVPNVLTHSDSKAWHSIYVATALSESPWKAVSLATVSPQVPPIFVVIIIFFAPGIQLGIYHCSRVAVPPGLNTIAWKTYFIFDLFTLPPSFKSISWLKNNWSEVEEIFSQGHTFTAWKIGKNVGMKTLKEVVENLKNLPLHFFLSAVLTTTF